MIVDNCLLYLDFRAQGGQMVKKICGFEEQFWSGLIGLMGMVFVSYGYLALGKGN
jgi:hypothetical protein